MKKVRMTRERMGGWGENRLLMVIWNILQIQKQRLLLWLVSRAKAGFRKPATHLGWASPVQLLPDPELVSGEGFVDLEPQLDLFQKLWSTINVCHNM